MATGPRRIVYKRPWLYDKQIEAIFCEERYGIVEASTKTGKTVGCLAWIVEQAIKGQEGWNYWWVAPSYGQAKIAFTRLKRFIPRSLYKANNSDLTITLANGAVIWFKTGEIPDNLYGEDVFACVIDEATRVREEAWYAIRSTLTATRGPCRIIGNVKGRRNWAYRMARKAQNGAQAYHYAVLTAWDAVEAGVLDREEVESAQEDLPESVFDELYLAIPSDDGSNPFGLQYIAACARDGLADGDPVVWGWDLAKRRNWTVGIGLNLKREVCAFSRFQAPWNMTLNRILAETGTTPAYVDSTGVGDPIVETLTGEASNFVGYKFTNQSKQKLMLGLAVSLQHKRIAYPDDTAIRRELDEFEYEYTRAGGVLYRAPEGMDDDTVMALALADHGFRHDNIDRPDEDFEPVRVGAGKAKARRRGRRLAA